MDAESKFFWTLDDIGSGILEAMEEERRLYKRYKELNPGIPNDPRDSSHAGIIEGLNRAFNIFIDAHHKNGIGGEAA